MASQIHPTLPALRFAHQWWLDASDGARRRFQEARRRLVAAHAPLAAAAEEIKSSGSTGRRKVYAWGPQFEAVDRFFHELVKDGDRLGRMAHLFVRTLTAGGGPNAIGAVDPDTSYTLQKHVLLDLCGAGPVPGLRDELAGWNVFVSPSTFDLLSRWTDIYDTLDPAGMVVFTGETLPTATETALRSRGFDVRDEMRCWDGGATFYTCRYGGRHWVDLLADTRTDGGELVSTDLFNLAQPHVDYRNGDRLERAAAGGCRCGRPAFVNRFQNRTALVTFATPIGIVATYDLVFNLFLQMAGLSAGQVALFALGLEAAPVVHRARFHYLADDGAVTDHDALAAHVRDEAYALFGMRVEVCKYVEGSRYKIRKVYWLEEADDRLPGVEAGDSA